VSPLVVVRGGGDLATGVVWRLTRVGARVLVTELAEPLTVRRTVALSTAVTDGSVDVQGMVGRRIGDLAEAAAVLDAGEVPVLVSPGLPPRDDVAHHLGSPPDVVVDARLAKRNIDTTIGDAPLVVALGPGFTAGVDCHAVIETMRGHHLGRVLWQGSAAPNTGTPGTVAGRNVERVLRAPADGVVRWEVTIGDVVRDGQLIGRVGDTEMHALFDGVVRGLIRDGDQVKPPLKIGDVDPRVDTPCDEISDKALAIGGGVVEAVGTGMLRSGVSGSSPTSPLLGPTSRVGRALGEVGK
jgi:xanthine dehydrogenase accessory factor